MRERFRTRSAGDSSVTPPNLARPLPRLGAEDGLGDLVGASVLGGGQPQGVALGLPRVGARHDRVAHRLRAFLPRELELVARHGHRGGLEDVVRRLHYRQRRLVVRAPVPGDGPPPLVMRSVQRYWPSSSGGAGSGTSLRFSVVV